MATKYFRVCLTDLSCKPVIDSVLVQIPNSCCSTVEQGIFQARPYRAGSVRPARLVPGLLDYIARDLENPGYPGCSAYLDYIRSNMQYQPIKFTKAICL